MKNLIFLSFLISLSAFAFDLEKINNEQKVEIQAQPKNLNDNKDNISDLVKKEECKKNERESEEACQKYQEVQ